MLEYMSTTVKPSHSEEDFFAREDAQKKKQLAAEVRKRFEDAERDRLKEIHFMHCPRCGMELQTVTYKGVMVDKCFSCGSVTLASEDLEKISHESGDFLSGLVSLFK